jgi:hypothetical protein
VAIPRFPHCAAQIILIAASCASEPEQSERHARRLSAVRAARRGRQQLFGELDCRLVPLLEEGAVVGQYLKLPVCSVRQPLLAEDEQGAPQPRHRLDLLAALDVPDAAALAARDDHAALAVERVEAALLMQQRGDVARERSRVS